MPSFYEQRLRGTLDESGIVHKFGESDSIPNGTWAPIAASAALNLQTTASQLRIKSGGNAADTAAGTGARSVSVQGLDANGKLISEAITTAGASASSPTSQSFFRVFRAYVIDVGAYTGTNSGDIIIETTGGTEQIRINGGFGQTQHCAYTIPAGMTGHIMSLTLQINSSKPADVRVMTREQATNLTTYQACRIRFYATGITGFEPVKPTSAMIHLPELTDIWIEARGGGAITTAAADMEIILTEN